MMGTKLFGGEGDVALSMPGVESTAVKNNLVLLGDTA